MSTSLKERHHSESSGVNLVTLKRFSRYSSRYLVVSIGCVSARNMWMSVTQETVICPLKASVSSDVICKARSVQIISRSSGGKENTPLERAREALESAGKDLVFFLMLVMVDFAYSC